MCHIYIHSSKEQLRTLGLSSLERRRLRGHCGALCSFLGRGRGEGGAEPFSLASRDRTPGNGSKLRQGSVFRPDTRKRFCTERVVRHWDRLPGEGLVPPARQCFRGTWTTPLATGFDLVGPELVRQLE